MIEKKKKTNNVKMKKLDGNKYKVLECKGHSGLTVGSYSRKPGYIFLESEWNFGEAALRKALAGKRCVLLKPKKKKEEKDDSK